MSMENINVKIECKATASTSTVWERFEYFLNIVNQMCIGFITIYMSWLCLRFGLKSTALHAWLTTIGFCFLSAEGILCFYNGNILASTYKRSTKAIIHTVLQVLGGSFGMAGALYVLIPGKFKFYSIHDKLGFVTFIFCVITMFSGFCALFPQPFRRVLSPLLNKTLHNFLGIATFVLALITQFYGYEMHFITRNVTYDFEVLLKVLTMIILVLTCVGPLKAMYTKIQNINENYT